ncbi:MAG: L-aspartate oxidase [Phycisphaerae bacterium]|jgi:L-aspartate oxidase
MSTTIIRRRYLTNFQHHRLPHLFTDTLVLGTGVAGLTAALEAAEGGEVLLVTKEHAEQSATVYAQGGIAAAATDAGDSPARHAADTITAACGLGHEDIINLVVGAAPACIELLSHWGARFDQENGHLARGQEGGHTTRRIVHASDATGREIVRVLLERVRRHPRIRLFDGCFAIDLLTHEAGVVGAVTFHPKYGHQMLRATTTILASGGAGRIYRETTNPAVATADGLAMALRAGAVLRDVEMVQFHPTTLYIAGAARALISEAVRGEGGLLVNRAGQRFMPDYDERAELAPRDVVSQAMLTEMRRDQAACVYLDVRHFPPGRFAERFPNIARLCIDFDIRPERDLIPVRPAAHYMVGGVVVDTQGRTSLPGLLACGEVSCTGLHGANRLASNSLLEGLVYGQRAGRLAAERAGSNGRVFQSPAISHVLPQSPRSALDLEDVLSSLRSLMSRRVGVQRDAGELDEARELIQFWGRYVMDKVFDEPMAWETQNMLTVALCVATAALERRESRGVHYRTDFPQTDPAWQRHIDLALVAEQLEVSTSPVGKSADGVR